MAVALVAKMRTTIMLKLKEVVMAVIKMMIQVNQVVVSWLFTLYFILYIFLTHIFSLFCYSDWWRE